MKFAERGYDVFDIIRTELWNDNNVTMKHYRQNLLLFIKRNTKNSKIGEEMSKNATKIYDMVLPDVYEMNAFYLNSVLNSRTYRYVAKIAKFFSAFRKSVNKKASSNL